MPLFPPGAAVTIVIDGRPLRAYSRAYVANGRVFAPVDPLLTRLAERLWFDGNTLVVQRDSRRIRVPIPGGPAAALDGAYIAAGPALHQLGIAVRYDGPTHRLLVRAGERESVASPTPFNAAAPTVVPAPVFTPSPPVTPRPVWTGSPMPRRTPLPFPPPPERLF
ncbi:MAG: hypothetical protein JO146_08490 [Candidatus Eremiobacteraeota bacterium]|nr:hypothetical protein [Candidatus Eremiobacteraeota bacterium]